MPEWSKNGGMHKPLILPCSIKLWWGIYKKKKKKKKQSRYGLQTLTVSPRLEQWNYAPEFFGSWKCTTVRANQVTRIVTRLKSKLKAACFFFGTNKTDHEQSAISACKVVADLSGNKMKKIFCHHTIPAEERKTKHVAQKAWWRSASR